MDQAFENPVWVRIRTWFEEILESSPFILLTSGKGFICSLDVEARQHVYIIEEFSLGFYHLATQ